MTAALQILETVQSLVVETEDGALTLLIEGQGISGPAGPTGPQGPVGPQGPATPATTLTQLGDVSVTAPAAGDVLMFTAPQNRWTNSNATGLVDGGNF
jgi:hypothetical protein